MSSGKSMSEFRLRRTHGPGRAQARGARGGCFSGKKLGEGRDEGLRFRAFVL
jgi:hypothetical protein